MDRKVVVCDAESHVVRAISLKFTRAGFDVKGAADAESCWRLLHGHESQELLILTDEMPSIGDAVAFVRRIREDARLAELPIVILTSARPAGMKQSFDWSGLKIADVVMKPFSPRELLATVSGLLGHDLTSSGTSSGCNSTPKFADRNRAGNAKPF